MHTCPPRHRYSCWEHWSKFEASPMGEEEEEEGGGEKDEDGEEEEEEEEVEECKLWSTGGPACLIDSKLECAFHANSSNGLEELFSLTTDPLALILLLLLLVDCSFVLSSILSLISSSPLPDSPRVLPMFFFIGSCNFLFNLPVWTTSTLSSIALPMTCDVLSIIAVSQKLTKMARMAMT